MAILKFINDTTASFSNRYEYITDPQKTDSSMIFMNYMISPIMDIRYLHILNPEYKPKCFYKHIVVALDKSDSLNAKAMLACFKDIGQILSINGQFPFVAAVHYKGDESSGVGVHCHYLIAKINHYGQKYKQGYHISTYKNTLNHILKSYQFTTIRSYSPSSKVIEKINGCKE